MGNQNLTIEALGPQGDGISLGTKSRIYVDRGLPGDHIKAEIYQENGITRGEILEILTPSPRRQKAPCVYYDRCGGCTLQHVNEPFYRHWKTEMVKDAFFRQRLRPKQWLETAFMSGATRRRVTFTAVKKLGKITVGYYKRRSQETGDIETCLVSDPVFFKIREKIKPLLSSIVPEGKSLDIFLQTVGNTVDMVLTGPVTKKEGLSKLMDAGVTRIGWRMSSEDNILSIAGKFPIQATFGSLKVDLPPFAFLQPTPEGEKALVDAVMNALPKKGKFADLFSGSGTFTGPMLSQGPVDAYESNPSAVKALARAGEKSRLKVFRRDLFRNPLRRDELNRYDAVVFDPPRAGCEEQAFQMAGAKCGTLIGISCNPQTFARDARILCDGGYRLQSIQVIDQFQWSHHVEVVGVFT